MIRSARTCLIALTLGAVAFAQPATPQSQPAANSDKSSAYYNFAMGRLYAELAQAEGNKDYAEKAIQSYRDALKADPTASPIYEELTDIYVALGRFADATSLAQDLLKQNPDNTNAHKMLARIYTASVARSQQGQVDERALRQAISEYEKVTAKDTKDVDSWVMLAKLYGTSEDTAKAENAYNKALELEPDNEEALTGLAMLYGQMGDTKRAIEKLRAATDKAPNDRSLRVLAQAYEDQKDFKDAAETWRKALAINPDDERVTRRLAEDLLFSDQTDEALKIYQDLQSRNTRDASIPLRMAEIYRNKHDFAKAHEYLDKAKAIDPDSLDPREEEIHLLQAEGKLDQAITALNSILEDTKTKRDVYSKEVSQQRAGWYEELGTLNRQANHFRAAIDAFKQMASLVKDTAPLVSVQIIETYRAAHDLQSAQGEADSALKLYPNDYLVAREHADVLGDLGKTDQAVKELKALLNGPRDNETLRDIASIYEKGKKFAEMAQTLDDAEKIASSDEDRQEVFFMRGAMYERQKKYGEAETAFRKVLSINPDNAGALNYLGYMFADRNERLDEAFQLVKKAVDLDPNNGAYLDSIGWVYYHQGKYAEAERNLVRAVDLMATDPTVHDHLGDVYSKLGKTKEAIAQWTASLNGFKEQLPSEVDQDEVAKVNSKLDAARIKLAREMR